MAYAKKAPKANESFQQLKKDIAAGTPGCAYVFYGEESYLREYYLGDCEVEYCHRLSAPFLCWLG